MDAKQLYEMLRTMQEPKGYYFNRDNDLVFDLLNSLLFNKDRYGYMACPCRLASGDRQKDEDIICPCIYRTPDIEQYGSCYCGLYVSKDWSEAKGGATYVPERRPPEKMQL